VRVAFFGSTCLAFSLFFSFYKNSRQWQSHKLYFFIFADRILQKDQNKHYRRYRPLTIFFKKGWELLTHKNSNVAFQMQTPIFYILAFNDSVFTMQQLNLASIEAGPNLNETVCVRFWVFGRAIFKCRTSFCASACSTSNMFGPGVKMRYAAWTFCLKRPSTWYLLKWEAVSQWEKRFETPLSSTIRKVFSFHRSPFCFALCSFIYNTPAMAYGYGARTILKRHKKRSGKRKNYPYFACCRKLYAVEARPRHTPNKKAAVIQATKQMNAVEVIRCRSPSDPLWSQSGQNQNSWETRQNSRPLWMAMPRTPRALTSRCRGCRDPG
jgi:hypothetical protein